MAGHPAGPESHGEDEMRDLTILMDLQLGRPADMLGDAAAREIPIIAGCVFPRLGGRVAHLAVREEDVEAVVTIAETHGGVVVDDRECVVIPADYPGGAAAAARAVADAGIMVNIGYFGARGEVVMGTTDVDGTRAALGFS